MKGDPRHTYRHKQMRLRILRRDLWTCQWCGAPATTIDHVLPIVDRPDLAFDETNVEIGRAHV